MAVTLFAAVVSVFCLIASRLSDLYNAVVDQFVSDSCVNLSSLSVLAAVGATLRHSSLA